MKEYFETCINILYITMIIVALIYCGISVISEYLAEDLNSEEEDD